MPPPSIRSHPCVSWEVRESHLFTGRSFHPYLLPRKAPSSHHFTISSSHRLTISPIHRHEPTQARGGSEGEGERTCVCLQAISGRYVAGRELQCRGRLPTLARTGAGESRRTLGKRTRLTGCVALTTGQQHPYQRPLCYRLNHNTKLWVSSIY